MGGGHRWVQWDDPKVMVCFTHQIIFPLRLSLTCFTDGCHRCGFLPLQRPAFTSGAAAQRSAAIDFGRLRAQLRGTRNRAPVTRSNLTHSHFRWVLLPRDPLYSCGGPVVGHDTGLDAQHTPLGAPLHANKGNHDVDQRTVGRRETGFAQRFRVMEPPYCLTFELAGAF